ncbi:hypothetical protein GCM10007857_08300 [Bradyrhizobium iriomotense]|uniref:Uncharacterized protein n=1 Tax=Bradyrhizobium iriomotense TaxID=441950 RepID=A0ABQ6ARR9_9BRAD|nr:hypothetical protein GCM10007857_08300 [Bradyrhizobium iriomotense]
MGHETDTKAYDARTWSQVANYDLGAPSVSQSPDQKSLAAKLRKYRRDKPKFTGHQHRIGGILDKNQAVPRGATAELGLQYDGARNGHRRHDEKGVGFDRR